MDLSKVTVNSGANFVSSTMKPLCGVQLNNVTKNVSSQALVSADNLNLYAGAPVTLNNKSDIAGNVLKITALATAKAGIDGFLLKSTNEVVDLGSEVGVPVKGQIVSVATLGSGIEVYLPCDATLQDVTISTAVKWDSGKLVKDATANGTDNLPITILGGVVDAQKIENNAGVVSIKDTKAIRVRL